MSASTTSSASTPQVDFGQENIPAAEKAGRVREVFDQVANRYDLMNDMMSGGLHRLWKRQLITQMPVFAGARLLDLASGTGDIARGYLSKAEAQHLPVEVLASDINAAMLQEAGKRTIDSNVPDALAPHRLQINAEHLPFRDDSLHLVSIAFGMRNVTDREKALQDIYRVLARGGQFFCLEFSPLPEGTALSKAYDWYSFEVIPRLGEQITGSPDSYRYLVESIRRFPDSPTFSSMMQAAGFARVEATPMTHGVVQLHRGWKY